MKRKSIFCLLILVLVFFLSACGKEKEESTALSTVDTAKLDGIEYSNGSFTLHFEYDTDHWIWADDTSFPLDTSYLTNLIQYSEQLAVAESIGSSEDLSAFGLDNSKRYLTLRESDKTTETFYFGNAASDGSVYLAKADSHDIYLADAALSRLLDIDIYHMAMIPSLQGINLNTLQGVTFYFDERKMVLSYNDGVWMRGAKEVTESVSGLEQELSRLSIIRCVDYEPSEGVNAVCGLDPAHFSMEISYLNSVGEVQSVTLFVGGLKDDLSGYFATMDTSSTIYLLPSSCLEKAISLVDVAIAEEVS